jgi:predicted nucleic acid-binding protein
MIERADRTEFVGKRTYIDTNILIYFVEGFEAYEDVLVGLFEMARRGSVQLATSELTLLEVLVGAKIAQNARAEAIYRQLLEDSGWIELVPVSRNVLIQAASIRGRHRLSIPDAIHLATATLCRCDILLTNDKEMRVAAALKVEILNDWVG